MYKHLHLRFLENVEHTTGIFSFVCFFSLFFFPDEAMQGHRMKRMRCKKVKKREIKEKETVSTSSISSLFIHPGESHRYILTK